MVFKLMAKMPWPFLVALPAAFIALIQLGFSKDDIVETRVANLWVPTRSDFTEDRLYAESVGKGSRDPYGATAFSAMAIARDGGNIFSEARLNELLERMKKVEATTVYHKGITYTWDDICFQNSLGKGTVYKMPCFRYSVLDFFQEARWYFTENHRVTWYNELVRKLLVKPLVGRYGIMDSYCNNITVSALSQPDVSSLPNDCNDAIRTRTDKTFLPELSKNPLLLLSDIRGMEMNDKCRMCIESRLEEKIDFWTDSYKNIFGTLFSKLERDADADAPAEVRDLLQKLQSISESIDRAAVEEWYHYYVIRSLYSSLGAESYVEQYNQYTGADVGVGSELFQTCSLVARILEGKPVECPFKLTLEDGMRHLHDHADNTFSSLITAGIPFPFWDTGDETGSLFSGNSPVGGSGVNMSGTLLSSKRYLDLVQQEVSIDISDSTWTQLVETDPVYRWFIASVTNMTSHCGNGNLTGSNFSESTADFLQRPINEETLAIVQNISSERRWCTKYSVPLEEDGNETQLFFGKMFYDLLVDSDAFLNIKQGESDPYDWTTGNGCGYSLTGSRYSYTNMAEESILVNASRDLYSFEEGAALGAIDARTLMSSTPRVGDYNVANPLQTVPVLQNLYPALTSAGVVERVKNCNRPGGPLEISIEDATQISLKFKNAFEINWAKGWDDPDSGEVQFVGFFDDIDTIGTTGRVLEELTLDNGRLTTISIIIIAVVSAVFLFSFDAISSQVGVCMVGVALVTICFFGAIGCGVLIGIKINVSIAWTLPFIILGLGVDDMYIVLLSFRNHGSVSKESFAKTMKEVLVPVTMTSFVNAAVFAVMNIVDIPVIYKTAQVALISIIFLWLSVILCFPAYCLLDIKRQEANRCDVLFCIKKQSTIRQNDTSKDSFLYTCYRCTLLGKGFIGTILRVFTLVCSFALLGIGVYGITQRKVGFGLQDFFPSETQAHTWAMQTTQTIATWPFNMNWGEADYKDPDTQLYIMRQFEQVSQTSHVAEIDTKRLWLASFNLWASRQCVTNFDRDDVDVLECGRDQVVPWDNSTCSGTWVPNKYNAREKKFAEKDQCVVYEEGICRPTSQMHAKDLEDLGIDPESPGNSVNASWCPVFENFSDEKLQFCLTRWHNFTGGGGNLIKVENSATPSSACEGEYNDDALIATPLLFSQGPLMLSYDLKSDQDYVDLIVETRKFCDNVDRVQCWLTGIPYNFWEQFLHIEDVLLLASSVGIGIGFVVAFLFLCIMLISERQHATTKVVCGSLVGSFLIALTILLSIIPVVGISVLLGVKMTAFSVMSYLLSIGFVVEYAVHIVHRYMKAPITCSSSIERVEFAMSFLTLPMFMAYVSSTVGVVCLAFTEFEFNSQYFFIPLFTVMQVTFFFGCQFLPVLLTFLDLEALKVGSSAAEAETNEEYNFNGATKEAPYEIDSSENHKNPMDREIIDESSIASFSA